MILPKTGRLWVIKVLICNKKQTKTEAVSAKKIMQSERLGKVYAEFILSLHRTYIEST